MRKTVIEKIVPLLVSFLAFQAVSAFANENGESGRSSETHYIGLMPGLPLAPHDVDSSKKFGVIDSGVWRDHPQIGNAIGVMRDFTGEGLDDHFGHGTKVVLVLLRSLYAHQRDFANGVASNRLHEVESAKIIGAKRASPQEIADRMIEAIKWLSSLGVLDMNISVSLPPGAADYTRLCSAVANEDKVLFFVGPGNSGAGTTSYPAACGAINEIAVGAVSHGVVPKYSGQADVLDNSPPAPLPPSEYWREEGDRLLRSNDFTGADHAYQMGLKTDPDPDTSRKLTYDLAMVAFRAGWETEAVKRLKEAIVAMPSDPHAYVAVSELLTKGEHFEDAREILEKGLAAGADGPELRDRLARIFLDLDQPKQALVQITEIERQKADYSGVSELHAAAQTMTNIEKAVESGQPPLLFVGISIQGGYANLVRFIVRRWHPDLNQVPPGGKVVPLVAAAVKGYLEIVEFLLDSGAIVDARDPKHQITALMAATAAGQAPVCKELLRRGASLDLQDESGFTAFMMSAESGRTEIAQLLLDHGARTSAKSETGLTALDYARHYGNHEIVDMIEKAQACQSAPCIP